MSTSTPAILTSFLPPFSGYGILLPQALLLLAAAWLLFCDRLPGRERAGVWVAALCAALATVSFALFGSPETTVLFGGRIVYTGEARFAAAALCLLTTLWCLWTAGNGRGRTREALALALLSAMGASLCVAALDMLVALLALELTSMPVYVLIGYRRWRRRGLEGALKYFLLSVMTSLIMLYGMSFLVGLTGSTHLTALQQLPDSPLALIAVALTLIGLFAKLSAAPFHWWAPDAYAGAEPWSVAFAATVPKIAGAVFLLRLIQILSGAQLNLLPTLLLTGAVASMVLGAFAAVVQDDLRRLMAYSGVVNVGYLLILTAAKAQAALAPASDGVASWPLYFGALFMVAYALPTFLILLIAAVEGSKLRDLAGLSTRRPAAAWALALGALSLIGVPPCIGFFAKLNLFLVSWGGGMRVFVVLATAVTVVSAFYYLRIIKAAFFDTAPVTPPAGQRAYSLPATVAIAITAVLIIALGIFSGPLITWLSA